MSRGKPLAVGPTARLPSGMTLQKLPTCLRLNTVKICSRILRYRTRNNPLEDRSSLRLN